MDSTRDFSQFVLPVDKTQISSELWIVPGLSHAPPACLTFHPGFLTVASCKALSNRAFSLLKTFINVLKTARKHIRKYIHTYVRAIHSAKMGLKHAPASGGKNGASRLDAPPSHLNPPLAWAQKRGRPF